MISAIDRTKFGGRFLKSKLPSSMPNRVFGRPFNFDKTGNPRPSIDTDFNVLVVPSFSQSLLMCFDRQAGTLHKENGIIVIVDCEVDFLSAENTFVVVDVFVSHNDLIAFVAYTNKLMWSNIKYDALHFELWFDAGGANLFEFLTNFVFVDVEKLSFDFVVHDFILLQNGEAAPVVAPLGSDVKEVVIVGQSQQEFHNANGDDEKRNGSDNDNSGSSDNFQDCLHRSPPECANDSPTYNYSILYCKSQCLA